MDNNARNTAHFLSEDVIHTRLERNVRHLANKIRFIFFINLTLPLLLSFCSLLAWTLEARWIYQPQVSQNTSIMFLNVTSDVSEVSPDCQTNRFGVLEVSLHCQTNTTSHNISMRCCVSRTQAALQTFTCLPLFLDFRAVSNRAQFQPIISEYCCSSQLVNFTLINTPLSGTSDCCYYYHVRADNTRTSDVSSASHESNITTLSIHVSDSRPPPYHSLNVSEASSIPIIVFVLLFLFVAISGRPCQRAMTSRVSVLTHRLGVASAGWQRACAGLGEDDKLLLEMLPSKVAGLLKRNVIVQPDVFCHTTVYFSDLPGFNTVAMHHPPISVVNFLNNIFR